MTQVTAARLGLSLLPLLFRSMNMPYPCTANGRKLAGTAVDDLLRNTRQALGLRLDRAEADALVTFFDRNGDSSIQCEELEVSPSATPPRTTSRFGGSRLSLLLNSLIAPEKNHWRLSRGAFHAPGLIRQGSASSNSKAAAFQHIPYIAWEVFQDDSRGSLMSASRARQSFSAPKDLVMSRQN